MQTTRVQMPQFQLKNIFFVNLIYLNLNLFLTKIPLDAIRFSSCVKIRIVPSLQAITISLFGKQMQFHKDCDGNTSVCIKESLGVLFES